MTGTTHSPNRKDIGFWRRIWWLHGQPLQVAIASGVALLLLTALGATILLWSEQKMSSWIGLTEPELIAASGVPNWEGVDSEGKRMLVYERLLQTDRGNRIRRHVVYIETGGRVTAVSRLLPPGHEFVSLYQPGGDDAQSK